MAAALLLLATAGSQAGDKPGAEHRVETVATSGELESLGGIGAVSVDADGYVIMANFNKYVWLISPDGDVEVLTDQMGMSSGNAVLRNGDIVHADFETQSIVKIDYENGRIDVFSDEGLEGPVGLVEGPDGSIYVANYMGGYISRVPQSGGAGTVFARHEKMTAPTSIVYAATGDYFVADLESPILFKVSAQGDVTEFVTLPGASNGHIAIADGALYVTQLHDHRIVRVEFNGTSRTVAGTGERGFDDGEERIATISYPNGIAADPSGDFLYFNNHRGVMMGGERGDILLRRLVLGHSKKAEL